MFDHYGETAAGLTAACAARPLDDTPRLVLADHLEECEGSVACLNCGGVGGSNDAAGGPGDWWCAACNRCDWQSNGATAHAEFIRVQCELWRLGACPGTPTCSEFNVSQYWTARNEKVKPPLHMCEVCTQTAPFAKREVELWKQYAPLWYSLRQDGLELEPVVGKAGLLTGYGCEVQVQRGFPGRITTTQDTLIRLAPQLGRLAGVTEVRLSDRQPGSGIRRTTEYYWEIRKDNLSFHRNGIHPKIARCMAWNESHYHKFHGPVGTPSIQIGIGNRHKIVEQRFDRPDHANECLSRACVNYIRNAAGLDYLYPVGEQKEDESCPG